MRLIVQKYGGTSVGDAAKICNVARRLLETQRDGCRVVAVISAMAGVTDNLIKLAREVSPQPTPRELDLLLATGECAASALIAMAVNAMGGRAVSLTGAEAGVLTDRVHTKAKIANISPRQIHYLLNEDYIVVVAGFQGQTNEGETTTLGRGGSDLTAIALAGALNADACQIFTDVDGVFTCDPRLVSEAKKIDEISYDELLEMAGAGSKVMQSRAIEYAKKFSVPYEVRSSFHPAAGTPAQEETRHMEDVVVRGISVDRKQAKLTIDDVRDEPGVAVRIFFFFFQAEDGIRDYKVTGVQTCALPISAVAAQPSHRRRLPIVCGPMMSVRDASFIITAMMGTAITPLMTADQKSSRTGST